MSDLCTSCSGPLSKSALRKRNLGTGGLTGLCGKCWHDQVRVERHCCDCGAKLTNRKAVRCRLCSNRLMAKDKAREARRLALSNEARKRPDVRARRRRANLLLAERKMRWCPVELRADYFLLLKKFGNRVEAKAAIEANMTPLQRQLSRIYGGEGRVVAKIALPTPGYDRTLAGVSDWGGL